MRGGGIEHHESWAGELKEDSVVDKFNAGKSEGPVDPLEPGGQFSTATKTTVVGGGVTGLAATIALWVYTKWGIPVELTVMVIGAVGALVGRWAGKLQP